jgi:hypothetical protein
MPRADRSNKRKMDDLKQSASKCMKLTTMFAAAPSPMVAAVKTIPSSSNDSSLETYSQSACFPHMTSIPIDSPVSSSTISATSPHHELNVTVSLGIKGNYYRV